MTNDLFSIIHVCLLFQLFAIIVFSTTADQVETRYFGFNVCLLGLHSDSDNKQGDANACNYAIAIGIMAFLIAAAFICLDSLLYLVNIGNDRIQFFVAFADLILSLILSFLWLVGFIYLIDKSVNSGPKNEDPFTAANKAAVGACIAFSLFSSLVWVS